MKNEKRSLFIISISIIIGLLLLGLLIILFLNRRRLRQKNARALADAESRLARVKAEQELKRIVVSLHEKSAFNDIHPLFCDGIKNYDAISTDDKRQLIFLRLGGTQKEIAHLMGISREGVKRARQRLAKRIGLNDAGELTEYIGDL